MMGLLKKRDKLLHTVSAFWTAVGAIARDLGWALLLPVRTVILAASLCVSVARWVIQSVILLSFGLFGFAFLAMLLFGLVRTIFHPLFH